MSHELDGQIKNISFKSSYWVEPPLVTILRSALPDFIGRHFFPNDPTYLGLANGKVVFIFEKGDLGPSERRQIEELFGKNKWSNPIIFWEVPHPISQINRK